MGYFNYNGTSLHYKIYGTGTPVLMLHGWNMDHHILSGCMEPVFYGMESDDFKRIYVDLPGMGKTKATDSIKNSDDILELLHAFVESICPDQTIILVGESYGGYLARGYINKYRNDVGGVILICPLMVPGNRMGNVEPLEVRDKDEDFICLLDDDEREAFEYMTVRLTWKVWDRFRKDIMTGLELRDKDYLDNRLDGSFSFDPDKLDRPFDRPALILTGRHDTEVGFRDQFRLIDIYNRASYITVDRAGHNIQIEQPEVFTSLVTSWLSQNSERFLDS